MSWRGTRPVATLAAVALLAGALCACGGSGSGTSGSTSAAGGSEERAGQGGKTTPEKGHPGGGEGGQGGSDGSGQPHRPAPVSPLQVSGGGSGQFRVKGGDNSIQDFGEESDEGELEEAARVLHDFYVARAEEDWKTACASLSRGVIEQLEQLGARAKSGKGCPATLAALTPPLSPVVQRETTAVDAGSLRVEGDRGFLIYRGAESTVYAINMAREGGWKVAALAGVPLS